MTLKYFIKTFGCQQNYADSERIEKAFINRGITLARGYKDANYVIINTCMVRESAEERVYGLVLNLGKIKNEKQKKGIKYKIMVTGCMVGIACRDKTGVFLSKIRDRMPEVDEFLPIEEIGFDLDPLRSSQTQAWVPISNGCNNFCTYCVVPFTRGREISRPYEDIIVECEKLKERKFKSVTLLGQNVNSYGADLIVGKENIQIIRDIKDTYFKNSNVKTQIKKHQHVNMLTREQSNAVSNLSTIHAKYTYNGRSVKPVYVKHLGRHRIPTLFPYLLEDVAKLGFEQVDFMSSNPWDFSDELIDVIARNENITRTIHLPVQSGDNNVLKRMNRWYTREDYMKIVANLKSKVDKVKITTDIIVGFCGETDEEFENTVNLSKIIKFDKAYISRYSSRPLTAATKVMKDDVSPQIKKRRWKKLDRIINTFAYLPKPKS